jgi:hypothetical protein
MPKIRRRNLPPALPDHLLDRVRSPDVSPEQLGELAQWLDTEPEVPAGRWFKRLSGMTVCGEGELVKTFLLPRQAASGADLRYARVSPAASSSATAHAKPGATQGNGSVLETLLSLILSE